LTTIPPLQCRSAAILVNRTRILPSIGRFWWCLFCNAHHDDLTKSVDVKGLKIHVVSCFTVKEHHFRVWHTHMYHIRLNFEDSTNIRSFPLNLPLNLPKTNTNESRF
jgi:hypothetical protein